jgi:hypothetical protein
LGGTSLLNREELHEWIERIRARYRKFNSIIKNKFIIIYDIVKGHLKVKLDEGKQYETRWVWYHTLLAAELFIIIILLWVIASA